MENRDGRWRLQTVCTDSFRDASEKGLFNKGFPLGIGLEKR